jgi:hypothetical protein
MAKGTSPTKESEASGSPPVEEEPVASSSASAKKERVLHTRIPLVLEQELKRFARSMRVPVSNVVRVILEDALMVADRASGRVEEQLRNAVHAVSSEREQIRSKLRKLDPMDGIIAFQPIILAQDAECTRCQCSLTLGGHGWLGIASKPGPPVIVCDDCTPTRDMSTDPPETS